MNYFRSEFFYFLDYISRTKIFYSKLFRIVHDMGASKTNQVCVTSMTLQKKEAFL